MKYIFYLALLAVIYRVFMRPKVIVEHRHFYDKKKLKSEDTRRNDAELTDYEEIK
ncbi:MAG: hypothetical protein U5L45_25750 [Saprospiraceae bacterium]|nr:hypothetical protein [Saprospiraceae bacterium]